MTIMKLMHRQKWFNIDPLGQVKSKVFYSVTTIILRFEFLHAPTPALLFIELVGGNGEFWATQSTHPWERQLFKSYNAPPGIDIQSIVKCKSKNEAGLWAFDQVMRSPILKCVVSMGTVRGRAGGWGMGLLTFARMVWSTFFPYVKVAEDS